jgi:flagellin-like hook-associated protein FlgL
LKVASAVDDPVAFFQAKTLSDRARDFTEKKDGIDQGISTITAALDGNEAIENIVQQLKGIVNSAKSATTSSQLSTLVTQFNDLRSQINFLASDSQYQGLNLINGTGQTLQVFFSTDTSSLLSVASVDLRTNPLGLDIHRAVTANGTGSSTLDVSFNGATGAALTTGSTVVVTYAAAANLTFGSAGGYSFSYGTTTVTINVGSAAATTTTFATNDVLSAGVSITLSLSSAGSAALFAALSGLTAAGTVTLNAITGQNVFGVNFTVQFNNLITNLDAGLTELRDQAQKFGTNVALLQTRLDFTTQYVNTLQTGGDKLTLADLNEEGANLLALQTRQQLGIQALSFAGQSEQSILALFT